LWFVGCVWIEAHALLLPERMGAPSVRKVTGLYQNSGRLSLKKRHAFQSSRQPLPASSAIPAEGSDYCLQPGTEPAAKFRNASLKHSLARLRNPA